MLNPRVFSMTDWYIGSAGRWISMTFCRMMVSPKRVYMKRKRRKCLFEVDFGIGRHSSVADEVNDPFLAFIRGEVETGRKVALQKRGQFSFSPPLRMKHTRCRFVGECGSTLH